MTAQPTALPHPLTTGVSQLEATLRQMPVGGWDGLDENLVHDLAGRLMRVASMLAAHQAAATRVLDESGLAKRSGATSTGSLLAGEFGGDRRSGDAMVRTGKLMARAGEVEEALTTGHVSQRQATIIATKVDSIDATDDQKATCRRQLIQDAQTLTIKDLQRRADRITDVFKPEPEVDADENHTLEQREARAWAAASFRMWDRHDGTHGFDGIIPEAQADKLRAAIDHLAAPRRNHLHDRQVPDGSATPSRMGWAFAEMAGRLTSETLMGSNPVAVVTIDIETLRGAVTAATLSSGSRISAKEARLTACTSGILPAVMGGRSQVLDLGRTQRLFTKAQKIAMGARDRGCTFPGCDRPPEWCEAHHLDPWSRGGTTNIADGVLLCAHHHRTVHAQGWSLRRADDGVAEFRAPVTTRWQRSSRFRA